MILSRLGKRKTPTPLESDLPSITVAQEKQQYPIPRPKTEGNCDKYIYFPKVLCPSGLTSSMGRCEGVGQRADEIWCPQVQLEGGGRLGSLLHTLSPGVQEGFLSVDHLIHGGFLVPRARHDVLVIPRDVAAQHGGGFLGLQEGGERAEVRTGCSSSQQPARCSHGRGKVTGATASLQA